MHYGPLRAYETEKLYFFSYRVVLRSTRNSKIEKFPHIKTHYVPSRRNHSLIGFSYFGLHVDTSHQWASTSLKSEYLISNWDASWARMSPQKTWHLYPSQESIPLKGKDAYGPYYVLKKWAITPSLGHIMGHRACKKWAIISLLGSNIYRPLWACKRAIISLVGSNINRLLWAWKNEGSLPHCSTL